MSRCKSNGTDGHDAGYVFDIPEQSRLEICHRSEIASLQNRRPNTLNHSSTWFSQDPWIGVKWNTCLWVGSVRKARRCLPVCKTAASKGRRTVER